MTNWKFHKPLISLLVLAGLFVAQSGMDEAISQSRQLPSSSFQRYSRNLQHRGQSPTSSGIGQMHLTTPGVHMTKGESRTRTNRATPYNPGEPKLGMKMVRWSREKMPLKIWISNGLQLPKMPFNQLQQTRVESVYKMLASGYPFNQLPVARGWTPQANYNVAAGIEQWRIFEQEGLLKFGFTNNPQEAHILIFFTDNFQGTSGPGGIIVGANTCAQLFTPAQMKDPRYRQKPVIIEFSLSVNYQPEKLQGASAHEFGHALGIKAHSPYREDIMFADRVVNQLSEGDKATLRLLYRTKTPYLM